MTQRFSLGYLLHVFVEIANIYCYNNDIFLLSSWLNSNETNVVRNDAINPAHTACGWMSADGGLSLLARPQQLRHHSIKAANYCTWIASSIDATRLVILLLFWKIAAPNSKTAKQLLLGVGISSESQKEIEKNKKIKIKLVTSSTKFGSITDYTFARRCWLLMEQKCSTYTERGWISF